jgi:hypothetical protein
METTQEVKHCTIEDIGIKITGEDAQSLIDPVNKYLNEFASTEGKCPKCGSKLGGLMGSFTWGLAHGEGVCTGGLYSDKCGWPCRGLHYIKDDAGEMIFTSALPYVLAYHPEFVTQESST